MASTFVTAYVTVALIGVLVVFVASKRLGDGGRPALSRLGLSVAAGAIWPVMLLGVAEATSIVACAKVHEHHDEPTGVDVLVW